jgi:hypothetical protein
MEAPIFFLLNQMSREMKSNVSRFNAHHFLIADEALSQYKNIARQYAYFYRLFQVCLLQYLSVLIYPYLPSGGIRKL